MIDILLRPGTEEVCASEMHVAHLHHEPIMLV